MSENPAGWFLAGELFRVTGCLSNAMSEGFGTFGTEFAKALGKACGEAGKPEDWLHKIGDAGVLPAGKVQHYLATIPEIRTLLAEAKPEIVGNENHPVGVS